MNDPFAYFWRAFSQFSHIFSDHSNVDSGTSHQFVLKETFLRVTNSQADNPEIFFLQS